MEFPTCISFSGYVLQCFYNLDTQICLGIKHNKGTKVMILMLGYVPEPHLMPATSLDADDLAIPFKRK
jgi:hypothetical protein